jgi:hypothetical protein
MSRRAIPLLVEDIWEAIENWEIIRKDLRTFKSQLSVIRTDHNPD